MKHFIAIDLGGTKVSGALVNELGQVGPKNKIPVAELKGRQILEKIHELILGLAGSVNEIKGIGISIPGIAYRTGVVWAPNLKGWDNYPLRAELTGLIGQEIPIEIESDRSCHLMGEVWQGVAQNSRHVIFLAVGTGIGAGILSDGHIIHGQNDISGAIGWMALNPEFLKEYVERGCFESHASGYGLAYQANLKGPARWTTEEIFQAWDSNDPVATMILEQAIQYWGMACANLVSIFNPEKIIFGGGVFGPARQFIDRIYQESVRWAQPVSIRQVQFLPSQLGDDAGLIGAAYFAYKKLKDEMEQK